MRATDPSARGETINDVSRDVSHTEVSDRRLWLAEHCPACGAQPGVRCRERSSARRTPPARLALHAARDFRLRPCPACKARPGEPCFTPRGRPAARPHTARLHLARGELHALDDVWRALERSGAQLALVRFTGGGGRQGTLDSVSTHAAGRELARWWGAGESALAGALAAPAWGRYGTFRGQLPIAATLQWHVADRSLLLAGTRGSERFEETLEATRATAASAAPSVRDTSPQGRPPPLGSAANVASRSRLVLARRRATAQSAAGRPPRAPGCASAQAALPSRRRSAALSAMARCPPGCGPRRATAQSAAGRPPRVPGSRAPAGELPAAQPALARPPTRPARRSRPRVQ
jgi:hypothetical protein